jgi:hypothetical protein
MQETLPKKLSVAEYHQKCMARREEMMRETPPPDIKKKTIIKYTSSMVKNDPIAVLSDIEKTFRKTISVKDNIITIKNKDKFKESLNSLTYFTFVMNALNTESS